MRTAPKLYRDLSSSGRGRGGRGGKESGSRSGGVGKDWSAVLGLWGCLETKGRSPSASMLATPRLSPGCAPRARAPPDLGQTTQHFLASISSLVKCGHHAMLQVSLLEDSIGITRLYDVSSQQQKTF